MQWEYRLLNANIGRGYPVYVYTE